MLDIKVLGSLSVLIQLRWARACFEATNAVLYGCLLQRAYLECSANVLSVSCNEHLLQPSVVGPALLLCNILLRNKVHTWVWVSAINCNKYLHTFKSLCIPQIPIVMSKYILNNCYSSHIDQSVHVLKCVSYEYVSASCGAQIPAHTSLNTNHHWWKPQFQLGHFYCALSCSVEDGWSEDVPSEHHSSLSAEYP